MTNNSNSANNFYENITTIVIKIKIYLQGYHICYNMVEIVVPMIGGGFLLAYLISDRQYRSKQFRELEQTITEYLSNKGFTIEKTELDQGDIAFCRGCFDCWVKCPGECAINDQMAQINRTIINSDLVVFLSPIVFGQSSANIKHALDRGLLPHMLPYFKIRADKSTMHPPRYQYYPQEIILGYGEDLSESDKQLFIDITKKHLSNIEVLIWQDSPQELTEVLDQMKLAKVRWQL